MKATVFFLYCNFKKVWYNKKEQAFENREKIWYVVCFNTLC